MTDWTQVDAATRHVEPPFAAVDLVALRDNADDLVRRAGGTPIRVATKSVRCRAVLELVLSRPGFAGLMAYSLDEAIWLAQNGMTDVLVAYPTVSRRALGHLAGDEGVASVITLMVDDPTHLDVIREATARTGAAPVRVCLDVDASLRLGPLHLGARRSPVHTVAQAAAAAEVISREPSVRLVGVMFYDAQIAGLQDASWAVRGMKRISARELNGRRHSVLQAISRFAELELVNAGGTGSVDVMAGADGVTEVAAGSGLYGPVLFDGYRSFSPRPALMYALPVTRRPARGVRTLFGGGYVASGPTGSDRAPQPVLPAGLRAVRTEGVGEVQTPVSGAAASQLAVGDRVWWRPAKAGEVCERFDTLHLVDSSGGVPDVTAVLTYRGEGRCFG